MNAFDNVMPLFYHNTLWIDVTYLFIKHKDLVPSIRKVFRTLEHYTNRYIIDMLLL